MGNSLQKRRWYQFSLRTLLITITLLCLGPGGYLVYQKQMAARQQRAVQKLNQLPGTQVYSRPDWLWTLLEGKSAGRVVGVGIRSKGLSDSDLAPLADLSDLVWLDLQDTPTSDAGLAHLTGLRNLKQLRIDETGVTDSGLTQLEDLKKLEMLNVYKTRVTSAGIDKLRQALPKVDIVR